MGTAQLTPLPDLRQDGAGRGLTVKATLGDGSKISIDGIVAATGQMLSVPKGMEKLRFRIVPAEHKGVTRIVALEAIDADGRPLRIEIMGTQLAKAGQLLDDQDQQKLLKALGEQATDASVPADSRGVIGSIHQNNIDITLANEVTARPRQESAGGKEE